MCAQEGSGSQKLSLGYGPLLHKGHLFPGVPSPTLSVSPPSVFLISAPLKESPSSEVNKDGI